MQITDANFQATIGDDLHEHLEVVRMLLEKHVGMVGEIAVTLLEALERGGKILLMGNGGSAADAQHIAAELVGRFKAERRALPAIALTTDTSILTAMANDYGYEHVFARQVAALAKPGDVVVGITTSGNSPNVLRGIEAARHIGCKTIGLTGRDGGALVKQVDLCLIVPSQETPRIQEAHITIGHIVCGLIERAFSDEGCVSLQGSDSRPAQV